MTDGKAIAVVTGASQGIGYEICRQLALRGVHVFLTAREEEAGQAAVDRLAANGSTLEFHQLDITDASSIERLKRTLESRFGRLDVLVNNAAIIAEGDGDVLEIGVEALRRSLETNCYGPLQVCQAFIPLLMKSPQGRVINVSSGAGCLTYMAPDWAAYRTSKTCLNALTVALAARLRDTPIAVNLTCPGWVRTAMGGAEAPRSVEQGADTAVWLATEAPPSLRGKFLKDRREIPW